MASIGIEILAFLYGYTAFMVPLIAGAASIYMMKWWTCPLLTRSPCELTIVFGPDKARVSRVKKRLHPFFVTKEEVYWFGKSKPVTVMAPLNVKKAKKPFFSFGRRKKASDAPGAAEQARKEHEALTPAPLPKNRLHIYIEGIDQPLDQMERFENKEKDLTEHYNAKESTKPQTVRFPKSSLSFERNWALIVKNDSYELRPTRKKQPHKINLFVRIGLYRMQQAQDSEKTAESLNASSDGLQSVTSQAIAQLVGDIDPQSNYSAAFARSCLKQVRWMEKKFVSRLIGTSDMMLPMILIGGAIAIIAVLFLWPQGPMMGPRPAG